MKTMTNGHRISKSESHSPSLGVQSKSQFMLRSGMRINTVAETMEHIKKQRVKSYRKISFNIRKMDEIFKPKLNNPEQLNSKMTIVNRQFIPKTQQFSGKTQKLKTCINFYDSIKFKKSVIMQPELLQQEQRGQRIKTEHSQSGPENANREHTFSNLLTFRQKQALLPAATSVLKSSLQQDEIITQGIPGIKFKNVHGSPLKKTETGVTVKTSTGSLKKSMEKLSSMTKTSSYLHADELMERDADQRVELMYNIRRERQLLEQPKQWQFYNCLKLSQLSLYRSNLKLSCENWVLIDYLELKYIRGWNPKEQKEAKIAITLFITTIIMNLQSRGLDCHRLKIRICNSIVQKKLPNHLKDYPTLQNNTIISLWDLFAGLIYTNELDLTWQIIYTLGYLHKGYNCYVEDWAKNVEQYSRYIFIEQTSLLKEYEAIFIKLCQQICGQLNLSSFTVQNKTKKHHIRKSGKSFGLPVKLPEFITIKGNCVELVILFMECIKFPSFLDLFTNPKSSITIDIRYQVGFHYWQDRTHAWKREWSGKSDNFILSGKNNENSEFSAISYNKNEQAIAIINDSKPNMVICDCQSIFKWMRATVRRFQRFSNTKK